MVPLVQLDQEPPLGLRPQLLQRARGYRPALVHLLHREPLHYPGCLSLQVNLETRWYPEVLERLLGH